MIIPTEEQLKELCELNWKVKAILSRQSHLSLVFNFKICIPHLQELICK